MASRGYVDPNWPPPGGDGNTSVIIYGYTPSFAPGILGCVLYSVADLAHGWQLLKYRSWYFSTMMTGIGFLATRSASSPPVSILKIFIVVAPVFFAAAIYTILSRLVSATGRQYAPLQPKLILCIFITCDVVATIVQILGAALIGIAASNRKDTTTPNNILLAGLAFQAATLFVFIVLFGLFVGRTKQVLFETIGKVLFETIGKGFYAAFSLAVSLFYMRICFRLSETADGLYGRLNTNEVYFLTLEFMPVVLATLLLAAWHPGRCVPRMASTRVGDLERK